MLRFVNSHPTTVWVMIEFYESECHRPGVSVGGHVSLEPWQGMGWWRIDPGQSAVVYENEMATTACWTRLALGPPAIAG